MNVKTEICTLAQSRLGQAAIINDIDDPVTPAEKAYAKWYDICREDLLKTLLPNFALARVLVAQLPNAPVFGWAYAYQKPSNCLKVLGIGEVQEKENNYAVEEDKILCDDDYTDGLQLRYVKNVTDVSKFSPEFIMLLSWALAYNACVEITKDYTKLGSIEKIMPSKLSAASSVNAQENRPIRINTSKFKQAKHSDNPTGYVKR